MLKHRVRKPGITGAIQHIWRVILGHIVTGMVAWIPLIVTIWVVRLLINNPVLGIERLVRNVMGYIRNLGERFEGLEFLMRIKYQPGIGVLIVLIIFLVTGVLTRYLVGRRLIGTGERVMQGIPLVSRIYRSVQQIRDVFMGRGGAVFQKVCLVEYPRPGLVAVAFVMSSEQGVVQEAIGKEMLAVFVPTTPNPTSGYLVYLPPDEITVIDVTVEEAMKLIVSGGAYVPATSKDTLANKPEIPTTEPPRRRRKTARRAS